MSDRDRSQALDANEKHRGVNFISAAATIPTIVPDLVSASLPALCRLRGRLTKVRFR
jgi:hypothetical protein